MRCLLAVMLCVSFGGCTLSLRLDDSDSSKFVKSEEFEKVVNDIDKVLVGFKRKLEEKEVKK